MPANRFPTIKPMLASLVLHTLVVGGVLGFLKTSFDSKSAELEHPGLLELSSFAATQISGTDAITARVKKFASRSQERKPKGDAHGDIATSLVASRENASASDEPVAATGDGDARAESLRAIGESAQANYLSEVRRILESKKEYPLAARRLGHQGRVLVRFVVARDGQITEAKILEGSRSDILDRAARSLIENLGGLKPFPEEIRLAEWAVVVPIEYKM